MDPTDPRLIQISVLFGRCDGELIEIDSGDVLTFPDDFGRERKTTGVATEVEHTPASQLSEAETIVPLITEESSFVA